MAFLPSLTPLLLQLLVGGVLVSLVCAAYVQDPTPFKVGMVKDLQQRYAPNDQAVWEGTAWWQNWIQQNGGLKYGNTTRTNIQIVTRDTSTLNAAAIPSLVTDAYNSMVNSDNIDLAISPFNPVRTAPANNVTQSHGILSFGVSGVTTLFPRGSYYFSTISPSNRNPLPPAQIMQAAGAKTYSVFTSTESIYLQSLAVATGFMNASGMEMVSYFSFEPLSTDTTFVTSIITSYALNFTKNYPLGDVVTMFISAAYYPIVINVFNQVKPNIKCGAFFIPTNLFTATDLAGVDPSGWLFDLPFANVTNFGVPGVLGGTSKEFYASFYRQFGHDPDWTAVLTAANLVTYTAAVQRAGTINGTLVRQALLDMDPINTFIGDVKFVDNGTDVYSSYDIIQYVDNQPVVVNTSTVHYPAPFPWTRVVKPIENNNGLKAGVIAGVAVGVSVFVVAFVGIAGLFIKRQRDMAVQVLLKVEEGERRAYRIDMKAVEITSMIGSGSFGYVYKGTYRGADVAIKKLKKQTLTKRQLEEFRAESSTMVGLRHPNILLFMGVNSTPPDICIITELMPRGSLYDVLHDSYEIPFAFQVKMAMDVLKGLQFIHSAGFIHRDLKSPNLLIDKSWNIKIADFGLSCGKSEANGEAQISLLWTAPEILQKEPNCYSELSDVYSFGIILWEIMSRKTPFENLPPGTIATRVVAGGRPELDPSWDRQIQQVIKFSWDNDKNNRVDVKIARKMLEEIYVGDVESVDIRPTMSGQHSNNSTGLNISSGLHSTSKITFVTFDMADVNNVWELHPAKSAKIMEQYQEVVTKHVNAAHGYVIQNVETCYSVVFSSMVNTLNFCLALQKEVGTISLDGETRVAPKTDIVELADSVNTFDPNVLRVSIGIHSAVPTILKDPLTNAVKYAGPGVDIASQLCTMAHGGEVLFGADVYAMAMQMLANVEPFHVERLGYRKEGCLPDEFVVYQLVPEDSFSNLEYFRTTPLPAKKPPCWLINYSDLSVETILGSGSFGSVYSAKFRNNAVVLKQFMKQKYAQGVGLQMRAESARLCKLDHKNVVKFYGLVPTEPNIGFITEYCSRGSLNTTLYDATRDLPWPQRLKFALGAAKGMAYLSGKGIVHGDLKSPNLMLAENWKVKVTDAGFSKIKLDNQTMTQIGAVSWTAPEVTRDALYSEKSDVYSFGIILWEIVFRTRPWEGLHTMKLIVTVENGGRPSMSNWPNSVPTTLQPIMQACWHQDPEQRPTFSDVVLRLKSIR